MSWKTKAKVMKVCDAIPAGSRIYRLIQKTFGRLKADPLTRIYAHIKMMRWILQMGGTVDGKVVFEVGTGHNPIVPLCFFLCGAEQVITTDLNRRLDIGILEKSLFWMAENRDKICRCYDWIAEKEVLIKKLNLVDRLKHSPKKLLSEANIVYLAPTDAADVDLPDASVNYHISITVFEHIPGKDIKRILKEAKRILKDDGIAIHFIDLSDHFQHQDKRITSINFLRFSEAEWEKIAANQFAYCNRLRASDYFTLFEEAGFEICRFEAQLEKEAQKSLADGFQVDDRFIGYGLDDLCVTELKVALREVARKGMHA